MSHTDRFAFRSRAIRRSRRCSSRTRRMRWPRPTPAAHRRYTSLRTRGSPTPAICWWTTVHPYKQTSKHTAVNCVTSTRPRPSNEYAVQPSSCRRRATARAGRRRRRPRILRLRRPSISLRALACVCGSCASHRWLSIGLARELSCLAKLFGPSGPDGPRDRRRERRPRGWANKSPRKGADPGAALLSPMLRHHKIRRKMGDAPPSPPLLRSKRPQPPPCTLSPVSCKSSALEGVGSGERVAPTTTKGAVCSTPVSSVKEYAPCPVRRAVHEYMRREREERVAALAKAEAAKASTATPQRCDSHFASTGAPTADLCRNLPTSSPGTSWRTRGLDVLNRAAERCRDAYDTATIERMAGLRDGLAEAVSADVRRPRSTPRRHSAHRAFAE